MGVCDALSYVDKAEQLPLFGQSREGKLSEDHYTEKRRRHLDGGRVVVWFSAGATSAVAAKIAVMKYASQKEVCVCYCDTGGEHETNARFVSDVESWIGVPIIILRNPKYRDHWDVFEKERYIAGVAGARCTTELKKKLRQQFQEAHSDIQVFGFSEEEAGRAEKFRQNNPEVYLECPLIDRGINKEDCLAIVKKAGITLPAMYLSQKSGAPYGHNNCIGCPKGGAGYWNKIRIDFPEAFKRMARLEKELGVRLVKVRGVRTFLDDLPEDYGRFEEEAPIECGLTCGQLMAEFSSSD